MIALLRPIRIRYYVNLMKKRGIPVAQVLTNSGIKVKQLEDPSLLVDGEQCETVIRNMLRLTGNTSLGLEIGSSVQLTDFGILAHAMMSSQTLREAVFIWLRFYNLVGMTMQINIEVSKNSWTTHFDTGSSDINLKHFYFEEMMLAGATIAKTLTGKIVTITDCKLDFSPPPHAALYHELLGCPIHFNEECCSLTMTSPLLSESLRSSDPEFNEICLDHCSQILRQISTNSPIIGQIRSLFLRYPHEIPSLERAAKHIGISTRTIKRQLQTEGTSFQKLLDEYRYGLAMKYLESRQLTLKEISYQLGFSGVSSFRRAFKAWSGQTLQDFRDKNL